MTPSANTNAGPAETGLFEDLPAPSAVQVQAARAKATVKRSTGAPRLLEPNRLQIELRALDLESLLPADHRARLVWGYVTRQDLSKLFDAYFSDRGRPFQADRGRQIWVAGGSAGEARRNWFDCS
jgi:hypothetical protein